MTLNGELDEMPIVCSPVLYKALNLRNAGTDKEAYDESARELATLFVKNSDILITSKPCG
jgi:hypothetical protein